MNEISPLELGKQLMKPSGKSGIMVGKTMNISNSAIYSLACTMIDFKDNDKVLEIGFGNGAFFFNYFNINPNIKVFGVDYSDTMCSEATILNQRYINNKKLSLKCEDSLKISFDTDYFDTIIAINTIYFWNSSIDEQIEEIRRLLKSDGKLLLGLRPKSSMENPPFTKEVFRLFEPLQIIELLQRHNLKIVDEQARNVSRKSVDGKYINSIDICIVAEKSKR